MSSVNFGRMSVKQIDELIQEALQAKEVKRSEDRTRLREQFAKEAAEKGFSLADLAGGYKATRAKSTGKHQYRNPLDASQTWTGRGRRPIWLDKQLKAGKVLKQFEA